MVQHKKTGTQRGDGPHLPAVENADPESLTALKAECETLFAQLHQRVFSTGGSVSSMHPFRREIQRLNAMGELQARECFWVLAREMRRCLTAHDPHRWNPGVPVAPARQPQYWGTPFPKPPTAAEIEARQAAENDRQAADIKAARQKVAKDMFHALHVRGIFLGLGGGKAPTLLVRPASYLDDSQAASVREYRNELIEIVQDQAEF